MLRWTRYFTGHFNCSSQCCYYSPDNKEFFDTVFGIIFRQKTRYFHVLSLILLISWFLYFNVNLYNWVYFTGRYLCVFNNEFISITFKRRTLLCDSGKVHTWILIHCSLQSSWQKCTCKCTNKCLNLLNLRALRFRE